MRRRLCGCGRFPGSVAHCGGSLAGSFVHTFVLTDIASGWTDGLPLLVREQGLVIEALDAFRARLSAAEGSCLADAF